MQFAYTVCFVQKYKKNESVIAKENLKVCPTFTSY